MRTSLLKRRFSVSMGVAALVFSALLPEVHLHLQQHDAHVRVVAVHRHVAAHAAAPAKTSGAGVSADDSDADVVWIAADQTVLDDHPAFIAPLAAISSNVIVPDPSTSRKRIADSGPQTVHGPPRLLLPPRAPPQLS